MGGQSKALPREVGSGSAVHRRFQELEAVGVFVALGKESLEEYDEEDGLKWNGNQWTAR